MHYLLTIRISTILILIFLSTSNIVRSQTAQNISQVSLSVSDLDHSVRFYTQLLEFREINRYYLSGQSLDVLYGLNAKTDTIWISRLQLGGEVVELMQIKSENAGREIPVDSRSNDLWFQHIALVVSNMELAYRRLWEAGVTHVSTSPQTLPEYIPAASGISAFYFRDPDGHNLELIHFPADKGNLTWQQKSDQLFLGIDHTAIGIEKTSTSLGCYRDILGLSVAGNSENFGPEQAHLNQVFGARLLITGLRAQAGIGLEFLDYIAPPGGRPFPPNSRPQDLWHWQTYLEVEGLELIFARVKETGFSLVSDGWTRTIHPYLGTHRAFLMRGPDGHVLYVYETMKN